MSDVNYEPIFGDQSLFDGAPNECFCVAKNVYDANVYYKSENLSLFWFDDEKWKPLSFMSCTPIAIRRIIKEPKQWTWEDKNAGRLPDVLAKVTTYDGKTYSFVGESCHDKQWSIKDDSTGKVYHTPINDILPIETPEEKVQREQEEFVASFNSEKYSNPTLYREGLRDAYRKLKGGE